VSLIPHDGALNVTCDKCGAEERIDIETCSTADIEEWLAQHGWRSVVRLQGALTGVDDYCPKCAAAKEPPTTKTGDE